MKKTITILLLCTLLLTAVMSTVQGRVSLAFVAVNDTIPLTLSANEQPYRSGGTLFVPHTAFGASGLSCYLSYGGGSTLALYSQSRRLDFDLTAGTATDENGNVSNVTITIKNGYVYLPASVCAAHFGMSVSYLTSNDGYTVVRFTNGNEIYDNSLFIQRAENFIAYKVSEVSPSTSTTTPSTSTGSNTEETPEPEPEIIPATIHLGIFGGENLWQNLTSLGQYDQIATFFLTAEEILEHGDTLRQLAATGHHLGIYANSLEEIQTANQAYATVSLPKSLLVATDFGTDTEDFTDCYAVFVAPEEPLTARTVATLYDTTSLFFVEGDQLVVSLLTFISTDANICPIREMDTFPAEP
ncbi:MAG: hypothetical protein R3Y62_00610 [Eubacteriales bacterium]